MKGHSPKHQDELRQMDSSQPLKSSEVFSNQRMQALSHLSGSNFQQQPMILSAKQSNVQRTRNIQNSLIEARSGNPQFYSMRNPGNAQLAHQSPHNYSGKVNL